MPRMDGKAVPCLRVGKGGDLQLTLHSPSHVPWRKRHLSLTCTKASNGPGAVCTGAQHVQSLLTLEGCDLACHGLVYSQLLAHRGAEGGGGEARSQLQLLHEGSETKFRLKGQNLPLLGPWSLHSVRPRASGFRGQTAQPLTLANSVHLYDPQGRPL